MKRCTANHAYQEGIVSRACIVCDNAQEARARP